MEHPASIAELLTMPWAIRPEALMEIQSIYTAHRRGPKVDLAQIEARLGRPLDNQQHEYTVDSAGVAVLPIEGVISAKANLLTKVSGGASAQLLTKQVGAMRADASVRSAVLAIDSPGGATLGTPELADAVKALAAEKPTVAVCTGQMCSAAYWIGSAANALYLGGATDIVGSIGVVMTHDYTPSASGTQRTEITAGKYKRIASSVRPLDAEGQAYLQQMVDTIYSVFVDAVAQNRGASVEAVLRDMADGRIFIGRQAIDAGLVDGFGTVRQLSASLAREPGQYATRRSAMARPRNAPRLAPAPGVAPRGFLVAAERSNLDARAKAYVRSHPGVDYLTAIKRLGAGD